MGTRFFRLGTRRLTCLVSILLTGCLRATSSNAPHAIVSLISERSSVQPGRKFWVGLRFELDKHWHIYWVNPGDSGEPPRVAWDLPQGFRAGSINWPVPHRLESPLLVDYGYEGEVLLMIPVYPPGRVPAGHTAELRATVKWLACGSICVPEQKRVALTLPFKDHPPKYDPRWRALFRRARAQLPARMPAGWSATVRSEPNQFILFVKTGTPRERTATFFPLEPLQIKNAAPQQVTMRNGGIYLALQKSDQLLKPVAFLSGILVMADGKAITINAPVISPDGNGKSLRKRRSRK